jgi:hypothetical protein
MIRPLTLLLCLALPGTVLAQSAAAPLRRRPPAWT